MITKAAYEDARRRAAQYLRLVSTREIGVKALVAFPGQTFAQHKHPPLGDYRGKEETFRCQWGELYLYTAGEPTANPKAEPPAHRKHTYTVWHETVLRAGDQITSPPNTYHWFQAGPEGAVVWSFSSRATDVQDVFTDPEVRRVTEIAEEG
jgi:D-lyxose ketol-isomerase